MSIHIRPMGGPFAAEVTQADLCAGLGAGEAEEIEQAIAQYGVLVFRNQPVDDEQQKRFVERFGPPVLVELDEMKSTANHNPNFFDVGTVDSDGRPITPDSARGLYMLANQLWHTDGSQVQPPLRLSALSARILPPDPPPTEYADMRAAWEALPEAKRASIEGLVAEHSILWSRSKIGMSAQDFSAQTREARKPVHHPLVRKNPRTGRKSLYLASHASHIVGLPVEEGRALIDELTAFATQRQFVYSHAWLPADLVMWDDSWTMHRAVPYEGPPRHLRWAAVRELEPV